MQIIFRMAVRNMMPEVINRAAEISGRPVSAEEHRDIHLKKVSESSGPPSKTEEIFVLPTADPIRIESLTRHENGTVDVWLEDFDTDEVADEEAVAVELLLAASWEIDLD
jgi:hypothetical protein